MNSPVIAIGLDSADPILLEKWMAQGHLKTLSRLKAQGSYRRLENTVFYQGVPIPTSSTEKLWVMAMTGCFPNQTKYWDTVKFNPAQYSIFHDEINGGYDYREYPPFYALGEKYKVAAFDIPVTRLSDQVNGLQLLGWGGHFPFSPSDSQPSELLSKITEQYGKNPVLYKDHGYWWKPNYANWLRGALKDSIMARTAISCDLLQRDHWDLFLTVFGESHSAGHDLWHLSQPDHPLYETWAQPDQGDAMLEVFECIDQAIAKIIDCAPKTAHIVCFSAHGMGINVTDLYSMTMLPEILYRFNFPGKEALAPGSVGRPPSPPITRPNRNTWAGEVWSRIYTPNPIQRLLRRWIPSRFLRSGGNTGLVSPYELNEQSSPLSWVPAMWYQRLWPTMRAFALPGFSDGLIRINLQGREAHGIVPPAEYDALN
jgi:predicted AlkP superfamily phosphohydrolase/phosphomutase